MEEGAGLRLTKVFKKEPKRRRNLRCPKSRMEAIRWLAHWVRRDGSLLLTELTII